MDEGPPTSYLLLARDTPVFGADGGVAGRVKEVLCDARSDIFDGLVVTSALGDRYLEASKVTAIHERGVDIAIAAREVSALPLPSPRRRVKYDLTADERPWLEVMRWLREHLAHLVHPRDPALAGARERLAKHEKALELAREEPQLALEAGVGRPDLPGAFDGGVVDVNHAPAEAIAALPGCDATLAARIVAVRERLDGFTSLEDLGTVLDLPGDQVEDLRERVVFLPR
ncbi:MAG TPA: helix-hairpin-helix domain-containing protein [Solirubrobacteraceae bacterium]|nr:helix-hairpin-helix domain-containing protein [Solirubrobacteraceae bacterium]